MTFPDSLPKPYDISLRFKEGGSLMLDTQKRSVCFPSPTVHGDSSRAVTVNTYTTPTLEKKNWDLLIKKKGSAFLHET